MSAVHKTESEPATLKVTEIFHSLQGEAATAGAPTVFIRLTGCPLRCAYCDTEYAFSGGERRSVDEILDEVGSYGTGFVTVTGGEPMAQPATRGLLAALCDAGYRVSLETGGSLDIAGIDPRVSVVMDLKTPSSGEQGRNRWQNLALLAAKDQIKFVIGGREDYEWAREQVREHSLEQICPVWFSPVYGQQKARELAEWILEDKLPVRLQIQLHKLLWGDERGR